MEGGRGARVAVPPDHVGAALALAAVWVTHGAERALRVTLALWETRGCTQRRDIKHLDRSQSEAPQRDVNEGEAGRVLRRMWRLRSGDW